MKKKTFWLDIVFLILGSALIIGLIVVNYYKELGEAYDSAQEEADRRAQFDYYASIEQEEKDHRERQERQRIHDSIAKVESLTYPYDQLWELIRRHCPAYSDIEIWRSSKEDWVMKYEREYGEKDRYFVRFFNPETKKFGAEKEITCLKIGHGRWRDENWGFKKGNSWILIDDNGFSLYEDNDVKKKYSRQWVESYQYKSNVKSPRQIRAEKWLERHRYDEDDEDDEEREFEEFDEDCLENNSLEMNLYHYPNYKPK